MSVSNPIKPLYDYPQTPMSEVTTQVMVSLVLADDQEVDGFYEAIKDQPGIAILRSRLEHFKCEASKDVLMMAATQISTPGEAVLYAHAIFSMWNGDSPVNMTVFCNHFHSGFPNPEVMEQAWDDQKRDGGNAVDMSAYWVK